MLAARSKDCPAVDTIGEETASNGLDEAPDIVLG